MDDEQKKLLNKSYVKSKVGVIKVTPPHFFHNTSKVRIGYTMVENTHVGKEWVRECNKMDAMFVPSTFLIDVFKSSGVNVPIHNVKQGINPTRFPYVERHKKENYIFSTIGVMDERKNWKDLVTAFCSEFAPDEPVQLWIKNSNPDWGNIGFRDKRIKVVNTFYSFDEMKKFYEMIDCLVFPSHAEGSGMPPREAMAMGLPVIMTNWSGLSEVCNSEFNYPLTPVAIDFPDVRGPEQPGCQARIDVGELMYYMRHVYEHQDEAIDKGKKASEYIHKNFNWDQCAKEMLQIIDKYR